MAELEALHSKASEQYEDLLISTSTITTPGSTRPSSPSRLTSCQVDVVDDKTASTTDIGVDVGVPNDVDPDGVNRSSAKCNRSRIPRLKLQPFPSNYSPGQNKFLVSPCGASETSGPGVLEEVDEVDEDDEADEANDEAGAYDEEERRDSAVGEISFLHEPVFDRFFGPEFLDFVRGGGSRRSRLQRSQSFNAWSSADYAHQSAKTDKNSKRTSTSSAFTGGLYKSSPHFATPPPLRRTSVQPQHRRALTTAGRRVTLPSPSVGSSAVTAGRLFSYGRSVEIGCNGTGSKHLDSRRRLFRLNSDARSEDSETNVSVGAGSNMSLPVAGLSGPGQSNRLPLNGTTFGHRRYLVHRCDFMGGGAGCHGEDKYLTPTQRAVQQVRALKGQVRKLNEELVQRRKEIADLTKELVKNKLESTTMEEAAEVESSSKPKSRRVSRLLLPDLTCFNCGFVLTLTGAGPGSCSCSEIEVCEESNKGSRLRDADRAVSVDDRGMPLKSQDVAAGDGGHDDDDDAETASFASSQLRRAETMMIGQLKVDVGGGGGRPNDGRDNNLSLPPPSLTDSGLGKEVEHPSDAAGHVRLLGTVAKDGADAPDSPSTSVETDKTNDELLCAAVTRGVAGDELDFVGKSGHDGAESPDDLFVSFEAVEMKLRDCEAEWSRKLEAAVADKIAEMERLRSKHNDKVEELLQRLDTAQAEYAKVWQKYQDAEIRLEAAQVQVESLAQALKRSHNKESLSEVDKEIQTTPLAFSLAEDGELIMKEKEKAALEQQLAKAEEELGKLRAAMGFTKYKENLVGAETAKSLWILALRQSLHAARKDAETSCDEDQIRPSPARGSTPKPQDQEHHETKSQATAADMFDSSQVTLQFLKSAVFYFLTDRENHAGHLRAIQNILNFSDKERRKIDQTFHGFY